MPVLTLPKPSRLSLRFLIALFFALFPFRVQAAPQPIAIALGGNKLSQRLWNNPDASLSLWKLAPDGQLSLWHDTAGAGDFTHAEFGPYPSYQPAPPSHGERQGPG